MAKSDLKETAEKDLFGSAEEVIEFDESYHMADVLLEQALGEYRMKKEKALAGKDSAELFTASTRPDFSEGLEDITTESLFATGELPVVQTQISVEPETRRENEPDYSRYESESEARVTRGAIVSDVEGTTASEKETIRKKRMWASLLIAAIIITLGALIALWAYQAFVMDNGVEVVRENGNFAALVEYADEFSMLSDSEKRELLDLQDDYDALNISQKEQINSYFLDQTGQTYNELLNTYILYEQNIANENKE